PGLFSGDRLNEVTGRGAQRQLQMVDKSQIAFFKPNYVAGLHRALRIASGEVA
ncbi:TDP-N-acetylfucosamine:lipid II N-acetylfucosaminyltransferase, partial [Leptospira borgpetersenii serovar Hardjo-bovis]|nr:TDP-N-acetylfucosamine:lipid II N-acetylfucosaminyltransferase [Leptospira borgpetersenii serovar Hardjo-bovis]